MAVIVVYGAESFKKSGENAQTSRMPLDFRPLFIGGGYLRRPHGEAPPLVDSREVPGVWRWLIGERWRQWAREEACGG
ncbi:hypothetical protein ES332_D12G064300v1 [Gossypium tomentosum]|uniref:Uncharacterized protein n=1 Tax=Gossypium tomentosum TaxID=34277 RepID=A0A5D2I628_GOSTO|nr:hypothetical protein ES332_D12G064300v1 [Gossypium tomentosum]